MTIDDVIRDFGSTGSEFPRASARWALDNWDVAGPRFVQLLDDCVSGADPSEATRDALFFIIHLMGEKREKAAFPLLCRLLLDAERTEDVLGDAVGETLRNVLISTYDGNMVVLQAAIEAAEACEFDRAAALEAWSYLARTGGSGDAEIRAYLMHLRATMQPRGPSFVWTDWALAVANLGYADLRPAVEELIDLGYLDKMAMGIDDFDDQLRRTQSDPSGMSGFDYDGMKPFDDMIGTLSNWYGFSEQRKRDEARRAARKAAPALATYGNQPFVDPKRRVGRNDPCPCGSGKKYKKCCLR